MNSCTICMKEELNNDDIYTTDCKHSFCKECLDDWFKRGNQTCPLCRSYIDTYMPGGYRRACVQQFQYGLGSAHQGHFG